MYGIEETNDGTLNLVLINGNNGNGELIYSENITGSNGTISAACYDPVTSTLFFMIGNSLYANNLSTDDPTILITTLGSNVISGATFMGSSY